MTETIEEAYSRGVSDTLSLIADVRAVMPSLLPQEGQSLSLAQLAQGIALYGVDHLQILRPWVPAEAISLKAACRIANRSPSAVREWTERYGIGRHIVNSLMISHPALLMLLETNTLALAALLAGRRDHPAVEPYFERAGLPIGA